MKLSEYKARIRDWEGRYLPKTDSRKVDLASVSIRKPCEKCGKERKRMHRHHKGNDFLWACLHEEEFAPRYVEFRPEDISVLCSRCHVKIHKRYENILYQFFLDWAVARTQVSVDYVPPVTNCQYFQRLCREECERWLKKSTWRSQRKSSKSSTASTTKTGRKSSRGSGKSKGTSRKA